MVSLLLLVLVMQRLLLSAYTVSPPVVLFATAVASLKMPPTLVFLFVLPPSLLVYRAVDLQVLIASPEVALWSSSFRSNMEFHGVWQVY